MPMPIYKLPDYVNPADEIEINRQKIETAIENMAGKKTGADIEPEDVLLGKKGYKGQELVVGTFDKDSFEQEVAEANRNGKYVWKKYKFKYTEFKISSVDTASRTFTITSSDFDVGEVTAEFFSGFENDKFTLSVNNQSSVKFKSKEGANYDVPIYNGGVFTISGSSVLYPSKYVVGDVFTKVTKEHISYTTSDDPTAYPDNGEQDGYWWEKVNAFEYGIFYNVIDSDGYPIDITVKLKGDMPLLNGSVSESMMSWDETTFSKIKRIRVETNGIVRKLFSKESASKGSAALANAKVKIVGNTKSIDFDAFGHMGYSGSATNYVFIGKTVENIEGNSYVFTPFTHVSKNTKIYCEKATAPQGYESYWNYTQNNAPLTTMWGVTEAEFDAL